MSDATKRVADLSPAEKRALLGRLIKEKGQGLRADPLDVPVHRMFEARVRQTPRAAAVGFEGESLSYDELNRRANRLAHHLRALGVGPGVMVGLCVERGLDMVVGLLGVLKAGGAYVPLDPGFPPARVAFMLADADAPVVVTQDSLRDRVGANGARVVLVDADRPAIDLRPAGNLAGGSTAADLAYVIYTSGSTGTPKGVMIPHRALTNFLLSMRQRPGLGASDTLLAVTTLSFDISALEIFLPLVVGGRVEVVGRDVATDGGRLIARLKSTGATVMQATPASWRMLLESGWQGSPALTAFCGGEALNRDLADRLLGKAGAVWNLYGPTETTIWSTAAKVEPGEGPVPIGRPIAETRAYVLDAHLRPVPMGVAGELYLGGAGLARGYLGRPALTAERFVPDPFSREPGARLYRTGDLARTRPEGEIECLGRVDGQVKIRGYRVELGEVESALSAHPSVREAAAAVRGESTGENRLIGYLVPRGPAPGEPDLRAWLKDRLPDYMVPSAFVVLDAMPMTPNGKIDRNALPAPDPSAATSGHAYEPPRTPVERAVAGVWADVLGRDRVGLGDDFFDLGGHSLLATQVVSRLRDELGVEVPLRSLFETPTVAAVAGWIEDARGGTADPADAPIVAATRDRPSPLSFAQESLWFLDQLAPGLPTFNVTGAVRVAGPLDVPALARAFAEIVARHEALRTTFETVDGRPVQVVGVSPVADFDVFDLGGLSETDRLAEARRRAVVESRRPFDLSRGPLTRAAAIRLDDRDHVVLLTMHHIVTDGWSFAVAARELTALYEAFRTGEPSPLPDLRIQYADYAAWQRGRLSGAVLDRLLGYWTRRLAGVPPLELPTDRPRPAVRSARGASRNFLLPEVLAGSVRSLGRVEGTTPFMTLLAAFQAMLHRYAGQDDFAVGSPVANRNRAEVEGLIGYFVNMLVLRADLSGDPTFLTLLGRVRAEALGAYEHQELPLERLVEALRPARDLSRTPLFQVMFVFQNAEAPDVARGDLTLTPLEVADGTGTAKFDLTLAMADDGPAMVGTFEYDADLFDAATIDRMIAHFLTLIEGAVSDPTRRVSELPLLPAAEREQVVFGWNRTETPVPADARVHRLFEAQAARAPDAPAVDGLTYGELDARANRLAHHLRRLGVGPDVRVGIAVERSPEMAVGLLGILKAGAAYVPLDPAYPRDRLAYMLDDARISVLLTQRRLRDRLPATGAEVVDLDGESFADEPATDPAADVADGDAAYVIYTSGSTGTPRGVVVTHDGLANHALAAAEMFGLSPDDRVLQFASLSFDIAVEELFPAWARGAAVVLRGGDETLDPSRFSRQVEEQGITVLDLPTAYWHAWVGDLAARGQPLPGCLRLVVVGGEAASPIVYGKWRAIGGDRVRWLNTYGPTETTVIATCHEPERGADVPHDLPIGRPIANARVYVLDPHGRPVPVGVPGELYIGGAGVARGYLGRPGLTAGRFVADPFVPASRLFRTGDRARWRADGQVEFLGRLDGQVKVRGHRVEPGEVEAALRAHPGVREAAVVLAAGPDGGGRLDAYIVPETEGSAPADEVRRFLRERLPRPLIPATFTTLGVLPMTPTGKVDRRALPPPDRSAAVRGGETVAPRDEVEARLASVWEEVLGVTPVGVTDSFFDLGGHSLLAIRLMSRVEEEFGRRLALSSLFVGPTVEEMAALVRRPEADSGPRSPLVAIQPAGERPPFYCVHGVGGIVYPFAELAGRLGGGRPFFAFQSAGLEGETEPFSRIEDMAASYVDALRSARPDGPYHLGGWSLGGLVAFEMASQLVRLGHEVATLALLDTRAPSASEVLVPEPLKAIAREVAELGLLGSTDPVDDALVLAEFAGDLNREFGANAREQIARLKALTLEERRAYVLKAFKFDLVDASVTDPGRVGRLWAVLRANLLAGARYRPAPYPGRVVVFRARDVAGKRPADPTMGWSALAAGGVTSRDVPGDHEGMLKAPWVSSLADALRAELDRGAP